MSMTEVPGVVPEAPRERPEPFHMDNIDAVLRGRYAQPGILERVFKRIRDVYPK